MPASEGLYKQKQGLKKAERALRDHYTALGVRTYKLVKDKKVGNPELDGVVKEIDDTLKSINEYQVDIERIKAERAPRKCPYCGTKAAPKVRYCPSCGKDMDSAVQKIRCPSCGGQIDSDSEFCELCGVRTTPMEVSEPLPRSVPAPPAPSPKTEQEAPAAPAPPSATTPTTSYAQTGQQTASGKVCPRCKMAADSDSVFCESCGARID